MRDDQPQQKIATMLGEGEKPQQTTIVQVEEQHITTSSSVKQRVINHTSNNGRQGTTNHNK
jgi:hypothetical protein